MLVAFKLIGSTNKRGGTSPPNIWWQLPRVVCRCLVREIKVPPSSRHERFGE